MKRASQRPRHDAPIDWGAFWRERQGDLTPYALALTRNPDEAEELIQVVLTGMIQRDARPESPVSYVFRAMRHAAIDRARRDGADQRAREGLVSIAWVDRDAPSADPAELARLAAALDGLSDEQREVVLLRTRSGLTLAEIGDVIDRPEGTVASRYARGIERLRELMQQERTHDDT